MSPNSLRRVADVRSLIPARRQVCVILIIRVGIDRQREAASTSDADASVLVGD